jgi:hypothetical protein
MDRLPEDFAETLARVLEPGQEKRIAQIIEAATHLDDEGLRLFLERFAARVRASPTPVKPEELVQFLKLSKADGQSSAI